jgi:polysaccharide biosynthesis/export protein
MKTTKPAVYRYAILGLFAIFLVFSAASCTAYGGSGGVASRAPSAAKAEYLVQPGDRLFISVWREETLQREVIVQPDGNVRFPLAGEVKAAGRSLSEIERQLKKNLSTYIPDPAISVSLIQSTGNRIYVIGRVNTPGEYVLTRDVDVLQAIALAGGVTPFAKKSKIKVLRKEKGSQRVFHFDYEEVENGERAGQNILLMPGDTIVVP